MGKCMHERDRPVKKKRKSVFECEKTINLPLQIKIGRNRDTNFNELPRRV